MRKVKVKATGKEIQVYELNNGDWCDYADCKTTYKYSELIFLN